MVLAEPELEPRACIAFTAEIYLLFHTTALTKRFQATVYIGNVIQNAVIEEILNKVHICASSNSRFYNVVFVVFFLKVKNSNLCLDVLLVF